MFLAYDKIQKLKCLIGYFNVKFYEKLFEKNDLQLFDAVKWERAYKSGNLGLDPVLWEVDIYQSTYMLYTLSY